MPKTAGNKLAEARLKLGLTLDEAAHATRMRPDKILALESDDYSCFPSNAYAKGFLKNYARYLHVDVTPFLGSLDTSLPVSIDDYQYLSNAPVENVVAEPLRRERRAPSLLPFAVGAVLLVIAYLGFWIRENAKRIFNAPAKPQEARAPATPAPVPALPSVPPEIAAPATLSLDAHATASTAADQQSPSPALTDDRALLNGAVTPDPADHDVVTPVPVPTPEPAAVAGQSGVNEILVATVKKTWVTVRRDDPKAPPIFEDYVYPDTRPLKLLGTRFFIEARDPASVQITKNGLPIAYQAPGVAIQ